MTVRRLLTLVLLVVGVVLGLAGPAAAHASLVDSDPAASAVLAEAPTEVVLTFDEEVDAALGGMVVLDEAGGTVADLGLEGVPGRPEAVRAPLPPLGPGVYVVEWRTTSADSHPISGAFPFRVGEGAAPAPTAPLHTGGSGLGVAVGVLRWFSYLGLSLLVGGAGFLAVAWPAGASWWPARRIAWFGWGLAAAAALGAIAVQGPYAAALPAGEALDLGLWRDVLQTRFGQAHLLRVGLLLVALPLLAVLVRGVTRAWTVTAALVGLGLAASVALAGHAGTGRLPVLGVAAGTAHTAAMAWWLGGLVVLGLVLLVPPVARSAGAAVHEPAVSEPDGDAEPTQHEPTPDVPAAPAPDDVTPSVRRFSAGALVAVAVVLATGVLQAIRIGGGPTDLLDSEWGRTLVVKVVLVAFVLALAAVSRRVVHRRWPASQTLRQSVLAEVAVGALVLVATVALVQTSPRADAAPREPFTAALVQGNLVADVTLTPAAVGTAELHLLVTVPGGSLQRAQAAEVRLTLPERNLGPVPVPLVDEGPNHWSAPAVELPFAGEWTLEVRVTTAGGELVRLTTPVTVTG